MVSWSDHFTSRESFQPIDYFCVELHYIHTVLFAMKALLQKLLSNSMRYRLRDCLIDLEFIGDEMHSW